MKTTKKSSRNSLIQNIKWLSFSLVLGLLLGGGMAIVSAWTDPAAAPPGGNIGAPINTGNTGQSKGGNLVLNASGTWANGLIVASGNVGIGTATPSSKLHIRSSNAVTPLLVYGGGNSRVEIARFYKADDTEVMRIQNTGSVGIGDNAPDGTLKLDVEGQVGASAYCDQNGANCKAITAMGGIFGSYTRTCGGNCTASCEAGDLRTGCTMNPTGNAHNNSLDYSIPSGTNSCTCSLYASSGTCYAICLDV
ncbi:MAG: TonB-dependent receptor [Parcubacteria group bacterium Athens0714_25]|nr:MAG: TonB-dependent receptor [Parcubacteria group bacterium Athens0714_25]